MDQLDTNTLVSKDIKISKILFSLPSLRLSQTIDN